MAGPARPLPFVINHVISWPSRGLGQDRSTSGPGLTAVTSPYATPASCVLPTTIRSPCTIHHTPFAAYRLAYYYIAPPWPRARRCGARGFLANETNSNVSSACDTPGTYSGNVRFKIFKLYIRQIYDRQIARYVGYNQKVLSPSF